MYITVRLTLLNGHCTANTIGICDAHHQIGYEKPLRVTPLKKKISYYKSMVYSRSRKKTRKNWNIQNRCAIPITGLAKRIGNAHQLVETSYSFIAFKNWWLIR